MVSSPDSVFGSVTLVIDSELVELRSVLLFALLVTDLEVLELSACVNSMLLVVVGALVAAADCERPFSMDVERMVLCIMLVEALNKDSIAIMLASIAFSSTLFITYTSDIAFLLLTSSACLLSAAVSVANVVRRRCLTHASTPQKINASVTLF